MVVEFGVNAGLRHAAGVGARLPGILETFNEKTGSGEKT